MRVQPTDPEGGSSQSGVGRVYRPLRGDRSVHISDGNGGEMVGFGDEGQRAGGCRALAEMRSRGRRGVRAREFALLLAILLLPSFLGGGFIGETQTPDWMLEPPIVIQGKPASAAYHIEGAHNWLSFSLDGMDCAWLTASLCDDLGIDADLAVKGWQADRAIQNAQRILECGEMVQVRGWWRPEYFVVIGMDRCPDSAVLDAPPTAADSQESAEAPPPSD